ncbi:hypothetical protein BO94DRAFT_591731, partial [Aspergillus sclerotioniger CBS 115572]
SPLIHFSLSQSQDHVFPHHLLSLSRYPHHHHINIPNLHPTTLHTTIGLHTVTPNDTIASISNLHSRGICDIARLNRMADATLPLLTGEKLLIPPETCTPDNSTCLILPNPSGTYADCVSGGPHAYYTLEGDTIRYIALKLNITVAALSATAQGVSPTQMPLCKWVIFSKSRSVVPVGARLSRCCLRTARIRIWRRRWERPWDRLWG